MDLLKLPGKKVPENVLWNDQNTFLNINIKKTTMYCTGLTTKTALTH